ncbi:pimeloyl-ACP methyl ester carboxylesterase [Rhodococcus sp. PvR044]|uniref:lipase family protein n=1 Tax=Rhodococcus TaxID=1827 RepID=UPI001AEA5B74|nr:MULTISPECIES: lipase family protein [Rhodococcus]MBP1161295.1 pimeloyl-ACP methyl ester carboxylesterase [Rhodococcus sp. PvR099]MCZ4559188.1 lipase [Rhodococcus maanshanensis]
MTHRLRTALVAAGVTLVAATWAVAPAVAAPVAGEGEAPGSVVSSEELPHDRWLPGTATASLLTYWSQGPQDKPMLSTGAVYLPEGTPPEGGWPVISYAHGTTGVADQCAPSVNPPSERAVTHLGHWLAQGYAVVATDYLGLGTPGVHPYLDGRSAAHSVIDMVRAARAVTPELSKKWVATGQSQGGHATLFTANIATRYAPELDYRGAVSTSAPSNIEMLLPLGGPAFPKLPLKGTTVYIANVLDGLRAARPDVDIDSYLSPLGRSILADVETSICYGDARTKYADVGIGQLLSRSVDTPEFIDAVRSILTVPTSGYDRPLLIAQGQQDMDVPIPLTLKLVADLTANGVEFAFRTYPTDHGGTVAASVPDSTPFIAKLFAGEKPCMGSSC